MVPRVYYPLDSCSQELEEAAIAAQRTSAIRRMFSLRSFSLKPRSLFRPKRTLSPSRRYDARPRCSRCCSSAVATVDLPDADRPVNQMVMPRWPRVSLRSRRESDGCHVMLLRECQLEIQRSSRKAFDASIRSSNCHCIWGKGGGDCAFRRPCEWRGGVSMEGQHRATKPLQELLYTHVAIVVFLGGVFFLERMWVVQENDLSNSKLLNQPRFLFAIRNSGTCK